MSCFRFRLVAGVVALALLAACGVDGPPERPEPGVSVTGDASAGIMYDG